MSHDYGRILRAIVASPLAAEQAQCALVYSGAGDIELMALHAAACADIICEPTPTLGHPIDVARVLQATFVEHEVAQDRRSRLN